MTWTPQYGVWGVIPPGIAETWSPIPMPPDFQDFLRVQNSNNGVDATLRTVTDGKGDPTPLRVSTTEVAIDATRATGDAGTRPLGDWLADVRDTKVFAAPIGSGAGVVPAELRQRFRNVANARTDFGIQLYEPDGVTVRDNTTRLQAAIDTVSEYGGAIFFPNEGAQTVETGPVTLRETGTRQMMPLGLIGEPCWDTTRSLRNSLVGPPTQYAMGPGLKLRNSSSGPLIFSPDNAGMLTIERMTLDGNSSGQSAPRRVVDFETRASAYGFAGNFREVSILNSAAAGIFIGGNRAMGRFEDTWVQSCGTLGGEAGWVVQSYDTQIIRPGIGVCPGIGLDVLATAQFEMHGGAIWDCHHALRIGADALSLVVVGTTFDGSVNHQVLISKYTTDARIPDRTFIGCRFQRRNTVTDNTFDDISSACENLSLIGCRFVGNADVSGSPKRSRWNLSFSTSAAKAVVDAACIADGANANANGSGFTNNLAQVLRGANLEAGVYPADFGAVGNGVANDTTALQRAMNVAQALGKPLVLANDATYAVTNLQVPMTEPFTPGDAYLPFQIVSQPAPGATIKKITGGDNTYLIANKRWVDNVAFGSAPWELHGVVLDGNSVAADVLVQTAFRFRLDRCIIRNGTRHGLWEPVTTKNGTPLGGTRVASVYERSIITNNAGTGFLVDAFGAGTHFITDATITDCEIYDNEIQMDMQQAAGWTLSNVRTWHFARAVSGSNFDARIVGGVHQVTGCVFGGGPVARDTLVIDLDYYPSAITSTLIQAGNGLRVRKKAGTSAPNNLLRLTDCSFMVMNFGSPSASRLIIENDASINVQTINCTFEASSYVNFISGSSNAAKWTASGDFITPTGVTLGGRQRHNSPREEIGGVLFSTNADCSPTVSQRTVCYVGAMTADRIVTLPPPNQNGEVVIINREGSVTGGFHIRIHYPAGTWIATVTPTNTQSILVSWGDNYRAKAD